MIRTPASGPEPANTLAYIAGKARGNDQSGILGRWDRVALKFRTEFKIDGFVQAQLEWYKANTLVSATAMLRFLNTTTDLQFGFAIDRVEHFIDPDGTLGFVCEQACFADDDAWFGGGEEIVFNYALSAWILLYEPRTERPPPGRQRPSSLYVEKVGRWSETRTGVGGDMHKIALEPRRPLLDRGDC
jgi:hypothetical protein